MIRKLNVNDVLKRYDNMTVEEQNAYQERVWAWLRKGDTLQMIAHAAEPDARLLDVMQMSIGWNDAECLAFEEGARLLSALMRSQDTWLPDMLYAKAAKRAIRRMADVLRGIAVKPAEAAKPAEVKPAKPAEAAKPAVQTIKAGEAFTVSPSVNSTTVTRQATAPTPGPVRPRHIDQYIHLLPTRTQERASQVKDLLRDLDIARENMRLLMDDATASPADRESWAKKATSIDNKLRSIYDELDREWDRLVADGRVTVDDLGNARVVDSEKMTADNEEHQETTPEERKQRKALRKWLCDTRYGKGDKRQDYVKRWNEKFKEYLSLVGDTAYEDEKIQAAAVHYGITLEKNN